MTPSRQSYSLEGELVRDWMEFEYDDLEIDGQGVMRFVLETLGPGRVEDVGAEIATGYHEKTHLGRVRLTIEVLPGASGEKRRDIDT